MKQFYITTAIDYANGSPHIGHAYEKVLADVIARYRRLKEDGTVYFLTGLDEHGQKIKQTADKLELEPQALCDQVAEEFKALCETLTITNDDFIRTTDERHKVVVTKVLQDLYDKGEIYKATYNGFYSSRTEQFLQEKDKVNGQWPELYGEVIQIAELNYFFKLSKYQDWLIAHINQNPDFIFPSFRAKQVLEFLKEPINDLCISRPKARLAWGITLPFDEDFVTYVWFDALLSYVSAVHYNTETFKDYWPADIHVIGKDILVPAHGVYWPIILKASGIPLPRKLLVHGWWLKSGKKMSKSEGNVINPLETITQFGPDTFRYFVMREMNVGRDSNFSENLFLSRYNSDLGNDLGNLISRFLSMTHRYCDGTIPEITLEQEAERTLKHNWETCCTEIIKSFDAFQFHIGLEKIFAFIKSINCYIEIRSPWKLAKSESSEAEALLNTTLATVAEALRLASISLLPVMPTIATRILHLLGKGEVTTWHKKLIWGGKLEGNAVSHPEILFPRIDIGRW